MADPTDPKTMAVGVKEVYKFKKEDLENRLMLSGDEGMAWLTLGDMTDGLLGRWLYIYEQGQSFRRHGSRP